MMWKDLRCCEIETTATKRGTRRKNKERKAAEMLVYNVASH
jgi:hypothetical protein